MFGQKVRARLELMISGGVTTPAMEENDLGLFFRGGGKEQGQGEEDQRCFVH
jgi:hypothetical protein